MPAHIISPADLDPGDVIVTRAGSTVTVERVDAVEYGLFDISGRGSDGEAVWVMDDEVELVQ